MPRFDKSNITELKAFLYNSYCHDARIESFVYDYGNESIEISLYNPYFSVKIDFTFRVVELFLSVEGDWYGDRKEIICAVVEDDFSLLKKTMLSAFAGRQLMPIF